MSKTKISSRFFDSTRGQIVLLLRNASQTVNELAKSLDLTDNAVRAHLLTLERDGLVVAGGSIKGFRRPHAVYRLTDEARHVFPKSYDSVLNRLLDVLKQRLPAASVSEILRAVGHQLAQGFATHPQGSKGERVMDALVALEELGGAAKTVETDGQTTIKSGSCPFADAVSEHQEVCKVAEAMLENIVGQPVTETCDRSGTPKCRFAIESDETNI
jgi:predicted ArsR family transcriptional regulator